MTKTFTEKGIEYLLVEVDKRGDNFDLEGVYLTYDRKVDPYGHMDVVIDLFCNCEIISLLKDITEEQVKEIMYSDVICGPTESYFKPAFFLYLYLEEDVDTSLNWLLLKKI